ncbi:DUF2863 family protein [Uliginosibacterium sp. H1]|uniref:DUF2863 family protein n=1 Tax=Uliginosibacterium sp. H1 TaxID=3114757 RepID=UPI002E17BD85|nr:DUF2863 family protein [Uliginosibacterium sp. H1]
MKRARFGRRSGLPREAEELLRLAGGLAESHSRAEDAFWEQKLADAVDELLQAGQEDSLNAALDHLYASSTQGYEELADMLESRAECGAERRTDSNVLLLAAPLLAWSRFSIPSSTLPATVLANLRVHLSAHVLADGVKLAVADALFSPDQLPQGYCETARFAAELGACALRNQDLQVDQETLPETSRFLSDVRYVLFAIAARPGAPLFSWQEGDGTRDVAAAQWRTQGGACLTPLLAGCATETVLPDAFFAGCREADSASRPYSVRASVAFLSTTLDLPPNKLRAVVAPFHDRQLEEYRIGFTTTDSNNVLHGVVWPLLGAEDDSADVPAQIDAALRECGISEILQLDQRFPLEYCDDCGAPMYPSPDGEVAHAELPEDKAEQVPKHLH